MSNVKIPTDIGSAIQKLAYKDQTYDFVWGEMPDNTKL